MANKSDVVKSLKDINEKSANIAKEIRQIEDENLAIITLTKFANEVYTIGVNDGSK